MMGANGVRWPKKAMCVYCQNWDRDGNTPGKRPGVRDNYRKCFRSKVSSAKEQEEWRSPTDWCASYTGREAKVDEAAVFKTEEIGFKSRRALQKEGT